MLYVFYVTTVIVYRIQNRTVDGISCNL